MSSPNQRTHIFVFQLVYFPHFKRNCCFTCLKLVYFMLGLPILVSRQEGDFRYVKCGCYTCSQQIERATANYVSFCDSIHAPTAMALARKTKNKKKKRRCAAHFGNLCTRTNWFVWITPNKSASNNTNGSGYHSSCFKSTVHCSTWLCCANNIECSTSLLVAFTRVNDTW